MTTTVVIPFSRFNRIFPTNDFEDVTFEVLDGGDISDLVAGQTAGIVETLEDLPDETADAVVGELDDLEELLDRIPQDLAGDLEDLADGIPDPETIATDVADALEIPDLSDVTVEIEGSLFALESDFVDLLALALDQVDFSEVAQLDDVEGFIADVRPVVDEVGDLLETDPDDVVDRAVEELEGWLEDVPGGGLLLDPDQYVLDRFDELQPELVDEEVLDELDDAVEDLQEVLDRLD